MRQLVPSVRGAPRIRRRLARRGFSRPRSALYAGGSRVLLAVAMTDANDDSTESSEQRSTESSEQRNTVESPQDLGQPSPTEREREPPASRPLQKRGADSAVVLQQLTLPEHANAMGTVHGGVIMKLVDEAGAICAMRHSQKQCVTVWMDSMTFTSPVRVGEVLRLSAHMTFVGQSSMEVAVHVTSEDLIAGHVTHTNSAYLVFCALGEDGKPTSVPELTVESPAEREHWRQGMARQRRRSQQRDDG